MTGVIGVSEMPVSKPSALEPGLEEARVLPQPLDPLRLRSRARRWRPGRLPPRPADARSRRGTAARAGRGSRAGAGGRRRSRPGRRSPSTACRPGCRRRPWRSKWSTVPRPLRPEDARRVGIVDHRPLASYRSATSQMSGSGAMSPSMLKTPSVMTRMRRYAPLGAAVGRASRSTRSRPSTSLCGKTARDGLGQPDAVDDRGVVELVADDQVALAGDGRDDAAVGREAGLEGQRRLDVLEGRQPSLELLVQLHRARDGAHGAGPDAQIADGRERRLDEVGMRGQAEVVVRREADDRASVHRRARPPAARTSRAAAGRATVALSSVDLRRPGRRAGSASIRHRVSPRAAGGRPCRHAQRRRGRRPVASRPAASRWVMIGDTSRPSSSSAVVRYQVSNMRRPVMP